MRLVLMQASQYFFILTVIVKVADVLTVMGIWWLTWYLRFHTGLFPLFHEVPSPQLYSPIAYPIGIIFTVIFHLLGAYRKDRIAWGFRCIKKLFEGSIVGTLVLVSFLYFSGLDRFSRVYLGIFCALSFLALVLSRGMVQLLWNWLEVFLVRPLKTLLIGYGDLLEFYFEQMNKRSLIPYKWCGRLGPQSSSQLLPQVPYRGSEDRALQEVRDLKVSKVVISYPSQDLTHYESLLKVLSNELVTIKVIPDFGKFSTFSYQASQDEGIPVLEFNLPPIEGSERALKRSLDLVGSILFMILFSPLLLLIGLAVKFSSPGPVIYSQKRMGADGKIFNMFKFRTMGLHAEKETGAVWAVENDDRATPLGKFLRKTSLDELPQFYNVLKGDMSLVGPRPERPVFVEQFRDQVPKYMLRHKMKSGITGWAQVNGWRGNTSIEERINHDLFYIRNWSLKLDLKILVLTLFRGFVHPNAY